MMGGTFRCIETALSRSAGQLNGLEFANDGYLDLSGEGHLARNDLRDVGREFGGASVAHALFLDVDANLASALNGEGLGNTAKTPRDVLDLGQLGHVVVLGLAARSGTPSRHGVGRGNQVRVGAGEWLVGVGGAGGGGDAFHSPPRAGGVAGRWGGRRWRGREFHSRPSGGRSRRR